MEYKNFEAAFEHLKSIIDKFESNENISLDELVKNYEEGMKAYTYCSNKLDDTQKKIKLIDEINPTEIRN
ncbi:MAG TPA: exodeoxyribonuclease VII small subunit [Clostridiales bacterium]|nr:exodeoxyribonuclease VII small subunit [Clostridiales bacterium]